jgi:four helix bundle protein
MELRDLEVYQIARALSDDAWSIYDRLNWQDKKVIGNQFIRAVDSVGANIAEGFGRFHFLDRNKFNYNARGSLFESVHWLDLLMKRNKISEDEFRSFGTRIKDLGVKLNNYIQSTKRLNEDG